MVSRIMSCPGQELQPACEIEKQKATALEWLAQEIQKGIDSGPGEPVTPAFWQGLRDKLQRSDKS